LKRVEIRCPTIAPTIEITTTISELLGTLLKMSIPISSIFCPIAVEIAQSAPIGIKSQMYFLMMPMI
jgi:Mn2+/Fe2+ NRAMP family transporter